MSNNKIVLTTATVLMSGACALGCLPAPNEALGSLCAKSVDPSASANHCVQANQGPGAAWDAAWVDGGLPIQMWADWPKGVTLDQIVESDEKLNAWYADIDTVLVYVRDTKRSADSYAASMRGILGDKLKQAKDRQAELLAQKAVDAVGNFKTAITDVASAEKGPVVAAIAGDKQSMASVQAVFDQAEADAAPLAAAYTAIAAQFTAYRSTEATETAAYTTLAQQASQTTLGTLAEVEQAIVIAGHDASAKPNELVQSAMKLSAQLQAFEVASEAALAPYKDFLATHGATAPDRTSSALRSLTAMLGYIQHRVARSDATAASLLNGIAARHQALALLGGGTSGAVPPGSSSVKAAGNIELSGIAQAKLLKASNLFDDIAKARVAALVAPPPTSTTLKLPYLARRCDQLTTFLQLEPLCDPSSSSWREAGCASLRGNFTAATTERTTGLPALIAAGIARMRQNGVPPAQLDPAQARLDVGDIKGAAILYDAALRGTEAP